MACLPASGSTFPVGNTTVTCTATDPVGHTATGTFQVTVGAFAAATPTATPRLLPNTASADGASGVSGALVSLGLVGLLIIGVAWRLGIPSRRGTVMGARGRRRG